MTAVSAQRVPTRRRSRPEVLDKVMADIDALNDELKGRWRRVFDGALSPPAPPHCCGPPVVPCS